MIIRQGDLMLRRIGAPEAGKASAHTLAIGEESGHAHVADGILRRAIDVQPGILDVVAPTSLRVTGQPWRHDPIKLEPGRYELWVQRELTEAEELEEVRSVQD